MGGGRTVEPLLLEIASQSPITLDHLWMTIQFRFDHALEARDFRIDGLTFGPRMRRLGAAWKDVRLDFRHAGTNLMFQLIVRDTNGMVRLTFVHQLTNLLHIVLAIGPMEVTQD